MSIDSLSFYANYGTLELWRIALVEATDVPSSRDTPHALAPGPSAQPAPMDARRSRLTTPPLWLVALAAFTFFLFLQSRMETVYDHDSYYHIQVARLMLERGILESFPWAAFSLFRDAYGDKEWLFHAFLVPFMPLGGILGGRLATVLLDAAVVTTVYFMLRRGRQPDAALWTALFSLAGSLFYWRMGQCRPHLGSILCVLVGLEALSARRLRLLFAVGGVYALAYTASHVLLVLAVLAAILGRRAGDRQTWSLPAVALAGLGTGHLLHPNFPHSLRIWWHQNIDFYRFAWASDLIGLGTEIQPLSLESYLRNHLPLVLLWAVVGGLSLLRWKTLGSRARLMLVGAGAFLVLSLTGARFTEYLVPLSILGLGTAAGELGLTFEALWSSPRLLTRTLLVGFCLGALALGAINHWDFSRHCRALSPVRQIYEGGLREISAILEREAPNEQVYHTAWEDSPALFFFNPRCRYLVVLDPLYFYYADPTSYLMFRAINAGGELDPALQALAESPLPDSLDVVQTLRSRFQTRFVVARVDAAALIGLLERTPSVVLRYRGALHALFELKEDRGTWPSTQRPGRSSSD